MNRSFKVLIFVIFALFFLAFLKFSNSISKEDLNILNNIINSIDKNIQKQIQDTPIDFLKEMKVLLKADEDNLLILVNKKIPIEKDYDPSDLVYIKDFKELKGLGRDDLKIRQIVIPALIKMQQDAKKQGFNIKIVSTHRTRQYQEFLFDYNIRTYGRKIAETQSAISGHSQHHTGTTLDFIAIDDNLLNTKEGKWLYNNARKYGFSLSYPKGYEKETGYKAEPWHYMYIGEEACKIQKKYFSNLQYKIIEFFHENKNNLIKLIKTYT